MPKPRYEQSSVAKGLIKADQAAGLAGELVVPAVIGLGLDWYFEIVPWCTVVGGVLGFFLMMGHLLQLATRSDKASDQATRK